MFFNKKNKNKKQNFVAPDKKPPFYKRKAWKVFFIIVGILLLAGGCFAFYLVKTGSKVFEGGVSASALLKTARGVEDGLKGTGDDRVNVLLLGMGGPNHPGGLLTDSIMVLSIEPREKKIAILSIPRDLNTQANGSGSEKLNSVFATGYNNYLSKDCKEKNKNNCVKSAMTAGANATMKNVAEITGLNIPYYFTVQFSGFEKIIDQLGGVDVVVDKTIYDPMFPSEDMVHYSPFTIKAGARHLDGATALKFARSRETSSDFDRASRQQKIIVAVKDKAEKLNMLTDSKKVLDIFASLSDSFYTNFAPTEIKTFLDLVKTLDTKNAITKVLSDGADGPLVSYNNGVYLLKPKSGNFNEIQSIAKNIFSTKVSANIELSNGAKLTTAQVQSIKTDLQNDQDYDLNVINTILASSTFKNSVIYDYANGSKPGVLEALKQKFGATSIQKTRSSGSSIDFTVILGQNYTVK